MYFDYIKIFAKKKKKKKPQTKQNKTKTNEKPLKRLIESMAKI